MLSVLGLCVGPLTIRRDQGDFLTGRITDLVIYEAARLMKKYPRLNASYADGFVYQHEAVHAGLAIDGGGRLTVYGVENADQVSLQDLPNIIADAVARYLNDELSPIEVTRATFTVTDLSGEDLDFVMPLLPQEQSCILGVTRTRENEFRLFAGFDHRVTEGKEVSMFLVELRDRLLSFDTPNDKREAACCEYCDRSAAEAARKGKEKGLLKLIDHSGREVLCCASCWNGW
jgi:hypothetical protein